MSLFSYLVTNLSLSLSLFRKMFRNNTRKSWIVRKGKCRRSRNLLVLMVEKPLELMSQPVGVLDSRIRYCSLFQFIYFVNCIVLVGSCTVFVSPIKILICMYADIFQTNIIQEKMPKASNNVIILVLSII